MRVIVVGGGASGMLSALFAAGNGHDVTLLEQNEKLGKKLFITGKGRCNVTNTADRDAFIKNAVHNGRFLYSAVTAFDHGAMIALLEDAGVPLKVERGGRMFPASDKSSDVLSALEKSLRAAGVSVRLRTRVTDVLAKDGEITGVLTDAGRLPADAVVLSTGGASYPSTGSTGDGYRFAARLGHTVLPPKPALVPLETNEDWPFALTGLTLKNVRLRVKRNGKTLYDELGEMLLTHFGVSGPLVLTASSLIADDPVGAELSIDFKPALDFDTLDARLLRDISENAKRSAAACFHALLPARLLSAVLALSGIDPGMPAAALSKAQRHALVSTLKGAGLTVRGTRGMDEAIVTRGGVKVSEIDAKSMESKLVRGLYFAGELIDIDAFTGGFNLQIAWSTGAAAGRSI